MQIANSVALVTGANRGIGRAFIPALLEAGARRVYATARDPDSLTEVVALDPERVGALRLDVTQPAQLSAAAATAADVDLLINNAGFQFMGDMLDSSIDLMRNVMEVNYFGVLCTIRAFAPLIEQNGGGAVVNVLSSASLASIPKMAGYAASKAAAHSLTQAMRPILAARHISTHAVYPGPVDTDMTRDAQVDKASPESVVREVLAGVETGDEDIFPDPMAKEVYESWRQDPKALERYFASML